MVAEVKMPALSPTMTDGKIISWNKKLGDKIDIGDVILEIETDKAVMEVEAQSKGILAKTLFELDQCVKVGSIIALIKESKDTDEDIANYYIKQVSNDKDGNNNKIDKTEPNVGDNNRNLTAIEQTQCLSPNVSDTTTNYKSNDLHSKIFASPLAKKIATENNIRLETIGYGSGPNGRIIKSDIEKFLSSRYSSFHRSEVEYIDIEPTTIRNVITERLTYSKQQIPHWYLKISPNMENFINFRSEINKIAKIDRDGKPEYKISTTDLFVFAIARAIKHHPFINSSWIDGKIRKYNNIDISIAVSLDDGVITPIIKNADQKNLIQLSNETKDLILKARNGKLNQDEYQGGCITISNLGMFDIDEFCSIINPPQSCIVAIGAIKNIPVVSKDNTFEVKPVCNIVFSVDHRVIDGALFAPFVGDVKRILENPALMFVL